MNNIINLVFPITKGKELAADHNYHLHAALSKQFPIFNQLEGLAINTISGIPDKQGKIALTPSSKLYLRLPVEAIQQIYPLAGQKLQIGEHSIQLGNPELQPLEPITTLKARLVTIKGYKHLHKINYIFFAKVIKHFSEVVYEIIPAFVGGNFNPLILNKLP